MNSVLIPNHLDNHSQFTRFYHLDIEGLEDTALIDELHALRPLLWGLPTDHWLRKRVHLLETELAKRRYNDKPPVTGKPKSTRHLAEGVKL